MARLVSKRMQRETPFSNVGIGSKLIFPRISAEQGLDKWTVYTIENGIREINNKTVPMLFICGEGRLSNGSLRKIRVEIPPEEFQTFLFKEPWEQVEDVIIFDDPPQK